MTDLYSGTSYGYSLDVSGETIPGRAAFKVIPGEKHVFERRTGNPTLYAATKAVAKEELTPYDRQVLSQIAVFGPGCITVRNLSELLRLRGLPFGTILTETLEHLNMYQLISFSYCRAGHGHGPKLITLTQYGSQIAKASVRHRFNSVKTLSMTPAQIKSYAAAAQLLTAFLKRHLVDRFAYRPVEILNAEKGQIVRPSLQMAIHGEPVCCECPRRGAADWLDALEEKMKRYVSVFGQSNLTVLFCGEDEEMCREIAFARWLRDLPYECLFTHDLMLFADQFSVFDYDANGVMQRYAFDEQVRCI